MMMEGEQGEEKDEIEHYLRALRKKVEHQVRNPFDLAFANYSFEELATWKNNVLQLDATSRLYGQRVDFLHCGALQILGSVLNNEQVVQQSTQQRQEIKKQQAYDNAPYQKNLELAQKISCQIERCDVSFTLWREIRKKRDALHELMLNELPVDDSLGLMLIPGAAKDNIYEQVFHQDTAVYMKLLDFKVLTTKNMTIYQEIQEVSSSINIFMLSHSPKARGPTTKVDSFMDLDFQYLDQDPFLDMQQLDQGVRFAEMSSVQLHEEERQVEQEYESSSQFGDSQDYFEFDEESNNGKPKKVGKINQKKREKTTKKRQQESVDFKGMHLQRNLIILPQSQEIIQRFINPRDFLLLKFVKYVHPYAKKHRKHTTSKFRPIIDRNVSYQEPVTFQPQPLTCQNPINDTFSWNPVTNLSRMSQFRFKEAALPIKQMKRKIREKVVIGPQKRLRFGQIKDTFTSDQPLDIFISVLHIAAEEQALIVV